MKMEPISYPAAYRDAKGAEATAIRNDGETLRMTLRGVEFAGRMLDDFEPAAAIPVGDPALAAFTRDHLGQLCGYDLSFDLPIPVATPGGVVATAAAPHVSVELGVPGERGLPDREAIRLTLRLGGEDYPSGGKSGGFVEDELLEIQRALPEGVYMKACINCAFGDYSVYGHGAFGGMLCFRDRKAEYLKVRTKREYMQVMQRYTGAVQETYLCPEFERRVPGTGYRG